MSAQLIGRELGETGEHIVRHICLTPTPNHRTFARVRHSGMRRNDGGEIQPGMYGCVPRVSSSRVGGADVLEVSGARVERLVEHADQGDQGCSVAVD